MSDTECPYCDAEVTICHDDGAGYAEGELHQQTCRSCDKTFAFTTSIHFHYEPQKADCLNGAEHDYKRTRTYPPEAARMRCSQCDDERQIAA
jgi:hypothetical protein